MRTLIIVLCAASINAMAQVVEAPTASERQHANWASLIRKGDPRTARALTTVPNGNALLLDYAEGGDCVIPHVMILVPMGKETDAPWSNGVAGSFRIDQRSPITFDGVSSSGLGDKYMLIDIKNVASVGGLLRQLSEGVNVRFQLGDASSTVVEKFSLIGADAAMRRAMQLCTLL
jgi:hypothetical protein